MLFLCAFGDLEFRNLMKFSPVGAELFHADRHNESNSRLSQFCECVYMMMMMMMMMIIIIIINFENESWYDHVPNSVKNLENKMIAL
jgi:hypothetical protein